LIKLLHFQTWKGITINYAPATAFYPLAELYKIEMTMEGINNKSDLFIFSDNVAKDYSWTVAFQSDNRIHFAIELYIRDEVEKTEKS
jgi:hypothetical protein